MISFTEKGAEKVKEFLSGQSADTQTSGLRVGVRGGGAPVSSTRSRSTRSARATRSSRITACASWWTVRACPYVRGAIVDYVDTLQGAGFKVENPNVVAACGCGSSFRVAEEEEVSAVYSLGRAQVPADGEQPQRERGEADHHASIQYCERTANRGSSTGPGRGRGRA